MSHSTQTEVITAPWKNKRRIGPKPALELREIWAIRIRLQLAKRTRDLALFNLAIDSKLRGCDLVRLRVGDIAHSGCVVTRATVVQRKTQQPVRFELTEQTRAASEAWIAQARLGPGDYLFQSRMTRSPHLSTRQYARILKGWVALIGLEPADYGTHSLRRTKATLIYRRTKTCGRCSCSWVIPSWRIRSGTLESNSTMPWKLPSRRISETRPVGSDQ